MLISPQAISGGLYIGLMSGTSMDAVDAILVEFRDHSFQVKDSARLTLPPDVRTETLEWIEAGAIPFERLAALDRNYAEIFAQAALLLVKNGASTLAIRAIGSHGQTLWHAPPPRAQFTLQIGDPQLIATLTGIPVVGDFRRGDLAVGGQGAPLAPKFHEYWLRSPKVNRLVINLGGIANISVLSKGDEPVFGWDVGPANILLDTWVMQHFNMPYDRDGEIAKNGTELPELLQLLKRDPYFHKKPPKSTGKEYFNINWLERYLGSDPAFSKLDPEDILATLVALTAETLANTCKQLFSEAEVIVCGGGAFNRTLMTRLARTLGSHYSVVDSNAHGLNPQHVEAVCFAYLAALRMSNFTGNLPSVTGAQREALLGNIYPAFAPDLSVAPTAVSALV